MKKDIYVILKKPVKKLGQTNAQCKVALGYAFNYLIPKGIAEIATKEKIQHLETIRNLQRQKQESTYYKNIIIKEQIEKISKFSIRKKTGKNDQFFGSINESNLSTIIFEKTGYKIDRKEISIPEIKHLGKFKATIKLAEKMEIVIMIQIIPKYI